MTPESHSTTGALPIHGDDPEITYRIEVIAEMVGVSTKTILRYQELGMVRPVKESEEYDCETLRQISRLEQLRDQHELGDGALVLIANLLSEIEHLRRERRRFLR